MVSLLYFLSLETQFDIDLLDAIEKKLDENEQRFTEERTATRSTSIDEF